MERNTIIAAMSIIQVQNVYAQEQFPGSRQNWNWRMFRRPVIKKLGLSLPLPERNPYIVGISMILYENGDCMLLQFSGWWLSYYPSEKYEFVNWDDDIPNVPNHHPEKALGNF